ncbi:MAG TPA: anhydro-N-acetylmuramic acid kinase [Ignavibacteria bacterium]|nr:anhydro-N-acetylmuramic acid kinase [Ignavibacteria bacterium]
MKILKGKRIKSCRKIIGILSGTSVDAVDLVLTEIKGSGVNTGIKVLDFYSLPINSELKNIILNLSSDRNNASGDICKLNFIIGRLFSFTINKFLKKNKISPREIDLIGSHGQTIHHYPFKKYQSGFYSNSTLQIGDISVIANDTGIDTVGDFRTADVAVNGQGAPLVPYLDYIISRKRKLNTVFLNIGGISNVTYISKNSRLNDVIAFDTGPGNILLDIISQKYFNKKFDKDGNIASKGKINPKLISKLLSFDKFIKMKPPKSTGRDYYNQEFLKKIIGKKRYDPSDIMATFNFYTAYSVFLNIKNLNIDTIVISGGGSFNLVLVSHIMSLFDNIAVEYLDFNGINSSNKEAVLFAVLANELVCGNKANIRSVTGADKNVFLGKMSFA